MENNIDYKKAFERVCELYYESTGKVIGYDPIKENIEEIVSDKDSINEKYGVIYRDFGWLSPFPKKVMYNQIKDLMAFVREVQLKLITEENESLK